MNKLIVSALNLYLEQDPERADSLSQIKGKVINISVREINLNLWLMVQGPLIEEADDELDPDVEIKMSVKSLPDYLMGVDQDKLIKNGSIEVIGDTHVASVMQNTLREVEIDWEEIISKYTGDAVAYQLGKGMRALHTFGEHLRDNLRQDVRDYLQDNVQVSATQDEVDHFIQQVDVTRAQVDRLEARLNRLQKRD